MAEKVTEIHMVEILDEYHNERIELERLRLYRPSLEEKVLTFKTIAGRNQIRKSKFCKTVLERKRLGLSKNKEGENQESRHEDEQKNDDDVPKTIEMTTVCDIWGLSKKMRKKVNESNKSSKENSAPFLNRVFSSQNANRSTFRRVARTTVLLESWEVGHAICTCEKLDDRCKVHD
jgi:hypothetical protein